MARLIISDLSVNTIIGTLPEERIHRQKLIISVAFEYDAAQAAANDDLMASVDYSAVEKSVVGTVEKSSFLLVEALAAALGKCVLAFSGVTKVEITISKPGASAFGAMITYSETFFPEKA